MNIDVEELLERPMHCIGIYVAAASLVCTLAMAADTFNGFRTKKYWLPSKYFSLNAITLTLLAVVMKLPVDLTTRMFSVTDRLAKVSSLVFMSTAMANFFTSLGSMDDKDILMNVTAVGILVITVTTNVFLQVIQVRSLLPGRLVFTEEVLALGSMLLLLVMFSSSALMITSTKRYLETKYKEMYKLALNEEKVEMGKITTDKLRVIVKKYWIMAETSCLQFVVARSVTCTLSGVISLLISLVLIEAQIRMGRVYKILNQSDSSYGWSTKWILLTQTTGVIIGTIAPASRWFTAISFRSSNKGINRINSAFTVEGYWTQKMVDWKQSSLSAKIRHHKSRKVIHDLRGLFLKLGIFAQLLIVMSSKLVLLASVSIISPPISCFNYVRRLKRGKHISDSRTSHPENVPESTTKPDLDIKHYVMLLEGEVELPTETLDNIFKEVDEIIQKGKTHKPKNLIKLLCKSCSFNGVAEFDSRQVPSLHSQNPPYCWSLPVVTLTSIALALPNIEKHKSTSLLNSVNEGLSIMKLVDKKFGKKGGLANIRTAANVAWVGVELHHKWQNSDLHETSLKGKSSEEILQELSNNAEKTVMEFKRDASDCLMKIPLYWPKNVIAANSMYRISRTILLTCGVGNGKTDEELFEQLSIMIADIMAACLTNLARVITMKCHDNAIEERRKNVRKAALLLGKTEEILKLLQQRELPVLLDPFRAAYIEEWRAMFKQENRDNQGSVFMPNAQRTWTQMPGDSSMHDANVEKQLEAPMPWIGMYVAAASLLCTLAMAADTFIGLRTKQFWFRSKFFSLNATSLTLLAVAMKLPVDLTTRMWAVTDRLAKVSSLIFLSTAMGNFMTCLGSMDDKDILMNVTALAILVITVMVNVCVQVFQMRHFLESRKMFAEEITASIFMLLLLVMVTSSAIMVPATKRYLESKYHEMMKMASDDQLMESMEEGNITFDKLRLMIKKYWVMAATSCPQIVIARSVTCTASGFICLLNALILVQAVMREILEYKTINFTASKYGWSVKWIVLAQSIGVAVGTIAPVFRCFTLQIRDRKWRKTLHAMKRLILNFVVRVQILIVLCSKGVVFISVCFMSPIFSCFHCVKKLKNVFHTGPSRVHGISESAVFQDLDLSRYVLLLEGEVELPHNIQINICNDVDKFIQTGKNQQPKNLINLLHKIGNFKGLREVGRNQVPSLHSQEPPKCWSLPLVTLTSIAIALPNIPKHNVNGLLHSLDEGIFYVKLIEKSLDKKGNLANSRNAADVIWVGVELYRKWQDKDLHETSIKGRNSRETLQELFQKAERTIEDFKRDVKDSVMENPLNWPVKVIAANSMYRICKRLLKAHEGDSLPTDEKLFEHLSNMIANILAACLTNLTRVIIMKCQRKAIKDKAKSVGQAALLLGETEEIIRINIECISLFFRRFHSSHLKSRWFP